jgi:hypothetical protein
MLFMPMLKRRLKNLEIKYLLVWILSILCVIWLMNSTYNLDTSCNGEHGFQKRSDVDFVRLQDDVADPKIFSNYNENGNDLMAFKHKVVPYNRNMPLIFVGGVPRSGTTLMRAMLDAHPGIRCGEETRIIPRVIYMRNQWTNSKKESERLKNAGMTDDIIDSAVGAFILEVSRVLFF